MTRLSTSLSNYHPVDTTHSVTLANGSLSTVASSSHTHLTPNIEFLFVLHVPGFLLIYYPLVKLPPLIVLLVLTLLCAFFRISKHRG